MITEAGAGVLIDVTRDFDEQQREIDSGIDAVLLTHAHRDACGGLAALGRWLHERSGEPMPVYASAETIAAVRRRFRRLDHCEFVAMAEGKRRWIGPWAVTAQTVPHARERHIPTFAWRLTAGDVSVVYASDVARLTAALRRLASGASILVIDGAMWRRSLFSHLTIDRELSPALRMAGGPHSADAGRQDAARAWPAQGRGREAVCEGRTRVRRALFDLGAQAARPSV